MFEPELVMLKPSFREGGAPGLFRREKVNEYGWELDPKTEVMSTIRIVGNRHAQVRAQVCLSMESESFQSSKTTHPDSQRLE